MTYSNFFKVLGHLGVQLILHSFESQNSGSAIPVRVGLDHTVEKDHRFIMTYSAAIFET